MITINGVTIDKKVLLERKSPESNEYSVDLKVVGKNDFNLYNVLFTQKKVQIEIPEYEQEFTGIIRNLSSAYTGPLDENTIVSFGFEIVEQDSEENEWTMFDGLVQTAINNWTRTRALAKILINNELMTQKEYEDLMNEIIETDYKEMQEFIFKGK